MSVADVLDQAERLIGMALSRAGLTLAPLEELFGRAKPGNAAARSIFRRAGRYLALGLGNVVSLFDPARILLSGERMHYDYLHAHEMLAAVADFAIRAGCRQPRIEIHAWGDLIWARGAAALALSQATTALLDADAPERVAQ